jgi:hypothetical protein
MNKWISIEDEYPTITKDQFSHETDVLVSAVNHSGRYHAIDRLLETDNGAMFRCAIFDDAIVTHWMHLPNDPGVNDE